MQISDRTCSPKLRSLIQITYPNLGKNKAFWKFTGYLMFGTYRDEQTGKFLIPAELIARIEGQFNQWKSNNYIAEQFLEKYVNSIQPFKWSKWNSEERLVRVVTELKWPQDIIDGMQAERQGLWKETGKVYFSDGSKFTSKKQRESRRTEKLNALELLNEAGCPEAKDLLDYINNLPSNAFYKILQNMPAALESVNKLLPEKRDRQIDILNAVLDQSQPFYKPTKGSTRIFAFNENMLGLQKGVRRALTAGWSDFDLKSAQLAICAKTWNVRKAQKFLKEKGNIWSSLFEYFQIEKDEDTKKVFKTALYAVMYGAGINKVKEILKPLGENSDKKFLSHPIIKSMWIARRKQLSQIRKDGGAFNCFGKFISTKHFTSKSVLAQLAQAYELNLLYPVIKLAKSDNRFQIVLWQHDGFSVHWLRKEDIPSVEFNLKHAVKERAVQLGINTELENEIKGI